MRLEPQHGHDIPTECAQVIVQFGAKRVLVTDRGDSIQIDPLSPGLRTYGGDGHPVVVT